MDVVSITATAGAFGALKRDQTLVVWGDSDYGGDNDKVKDLQRVVKVVRSVFGFCAVTRDEVFYWGLSSGFDRVKEEW